MASKRGMSFSWGWCGLLLEPVNTLVVSKDMCRPGRLRLRSALPSNSGGALVVVP